MSSDAVAPAVHDGAVTAPASLPPPASADTFPHTRHAKIACLVCHQTTSGTARLTFQPPRGCDICHHQQSASARCASCHQEQELAAPRKVTVTVAVPGHAPNARPVDFVHTRHADRKCVECHTAPVTLAPSPAVAQCKDCHTDPTSSDSFVCTTCHTEAAAARQHTATTGYVWTDPGCYSCHPRG
jgi:hypothetical protein